LNQVITIERHVFGEEREGEEGEREKKKRGGGRGERARTFQGPFIVLTPDGSIRGKKKKEKPKEKKKGKRSETGKNRDNSSARILLFRDDYPFFASHANRTSRERRKKRPRKKKEKKGGLTPVSGGTLLGPRTARDPGRRAFGNTRRKKRRGKKNRVEKKERGKQWTPWRTPLTCALFLATLQRVAERENKGENRYRGKRSENRQNLGHSRATNS